MNSYTTLAKKIVSAYGSGTRVTGLYDLIISDPFLKDEVKSSIRRSIIDDLDLSDDFESLAGSDIEFSELISEIYKVIVETFHVVDADKDDFTADDIFLRIQEAKRFSEDEI